MITFCYRSKRRLLLLLAMAISSNAVALRPQVDPSVEANLEQQTRLHRPYLTPAAQTQGLTLSQGSFITLRLAQEALRTRAEVIAEVKQRYDAKILKISLNKKSSIYTVRILLANGKVRNLNVSAKR